MIKRFCDICEVEIKSLQDGIYEDRYTLVIEDPGNLTQLGGQLGKIHPAIEMRLQNCNNTDICRECLEKILFTEFQRRSSRA
ncbi:MAG: hypothetical protein RBR42_11070 [Desulfomicrobium sp.]|jgi:hypothetical protein|nr:hypothetical protein [Desulfomicrobium sp.]